MRIRPAALALLVLLALCAASGRALAQTGPGVKRGLVILAAFPDVRPDLDRETLTQRFSVLLDRYVRNMSDGAASISVDVTPDWLTLPLPVGAYRISSRNLEVDRGRVMRLIDDALALAESSVDLASYDFIALQLGAKINEYGMVGLCGYPGMLGYSSEGGFVTRGGRRVRGVVIFTTQAHVGTLFHDVAHVLGGVRGGKRQVPCLYDHDLQGRPGPVREVFVGSIINMGYWDPMSCHLYRRDLPPPGLSSWTRLRLGWLDPARVRTVRPGERAEVLLGPLADSASPVAAIRIPLSDTRYYLIENRQPVGNDQYLPGSGALILRADDTVGECRHGLSPVKLVDADPSRPRLEGAAFAPGARGEFVDREHGVRVRVVEAVGQALRVVLDRP